MPTNGPNGIEIKIGGDTKPLVAAVEEAKKKVEQATTTESAKAVSGKASEEVAKIATNAQAATTSLNQMGTAANNAVGPSSNTATGLKALNKTLGDTVGQVQALFGKLTMVLGTATGFFALGRAIRESIVDQMTVGAERAQEFRDSLMEIDARKVLAEYDKQIADVGTRLQEATNNAEALKAANSSPAGSMGAVAGVLADGYAIAEQRIKQLREEQTKLINDSKVSRDFVNAAEAKRAQDRIDQQIASYQKLQDERRSASEEYNKSVDDAAFKQQLEREASIREMKDFYRELTDEAEKSARRTQQAWETSFRAIREASNAAFNTDNARSMVELAGNLNATATTATANMNRIIVGGTD